MRWIFNQLLCHPPPFMRRIGSQGRILLQEVLLGLPEFLLQHIQLFCDLLQPAIREEVSQSIKERECVRFYKRMCPTFNKRQLLKGILREKPFVTEADEAV